jgi:orotidine-5'-phosphate decarboxylase
MPASPLSRHGKQRIILALDVANAADAQAWTRRLRDEIAMVKIGLELFVSEGPGIVPRIREQGIGVFLDLKFHDIPHTVAGAVRAAARLGVRMLNVHASGGDAMLKAAAEAAREFGDRAPILLGVTVLTSLDDRALESLGMKGPVPDRVAAWARNCDRMGLNGVVASALEARRIRLCCGEHFVIVTPGIRAPEDPHHDQVRVATAAEAVRQGADYVVVGRAILRAHDPVATVRSIAEEIESALAGSGEEGTELAAGED